MCLTPPAPPGEAFLAILNEYNQDQKRPLFELCGKDFEFALMLIGWIHAKWMMIKEPATPEEVLEALLKDAPHSERIPRNGFEPLPVSLQAAGLALRTYVNQFSAFSEYVRRQSDFLSGFVSGMNFQETYGGATTADASIEDIMEDEQDLPEPPTMETLDNDVPESPERELTLTPTTEDAAWGLMTLCTQFSGEPESALPSSSFFLPIANGGCETPIEIDHLVSGAPNGPTELDSAKYQRDTLTLLSGKARRLRFEASGGETSDAESEGDGSSVSKRRRISTDGSSLVSDTALASESAAVS